MVLDKLLEKTLTNLFAQLNSKDEINHNEINVDEMTSSSVVEGFYALGQKIKKRYHKLKKQMINSLYKIGGFH